MALAPGTDTGAADPWGGGIARAGIGIEAGMRLGWKLSETKGLCCAFGRPPKITGVVPSGPPVMKPLEALVWALTGR